MADDQHMHMRASLQLAPLTILKARTADDWANGSASIIHNSSTLSHLRDSRSGSQMPPPTTPDGSQADLDMTPPPANRFNNFLLAV